MGNTAGAIETAAPPWWRIAWRVAIREVWFYRLSRWLPRLIWIDDEVDVTVTWAENRLCPTGEIGESVEQLFSGEFAELERRLSILGIEFDKGMGFGGRDWEWDWSLKGPVRIKFRGRCRTVEKRQ